MTMAKNDDKVTSKAGVVRWEFIDDELLDQLLASSSERGLGLTGEGGLLPELIKAVLEQGHARRADQPSGACEKNDPVGRGSGNSRNGTTPKTIDTEVGPVRLDRSPGS